jgi:hypothetical protein
VLYTNERNLDEDVESLDSSDNNKGTNTNEGTGTNTNEGTGTNTNDGTSTDTNDEMSTNNNNESTTNAKRGPREKRLAAKLLSSLTIYLYLLLLQLPRRCYILVMEVMLPNLVWQSTTSPKRLQMTGF